MLYARISLVFVLCCVLCVFQRSRCALKTQLWTLASDKVTKQDIVECQNCILNVAGAMRATFVPQGEVSRTQNIFYENVEYLVTGSDFAFMGMHSKCARLEACGEFVAQHSPSPSDNLFDLMILENTQEKATAERDPMCFSIWPLKPTSQIRSCLKEASVSNLIREYSVGSGDDRLTRSIILLYPQHNKYEPNDILRSCKHVDLLAVDPTKYVPDNECIKLSVQTSLAQPIPPSKMRTKWKTPTSSQGTKVPIKFSGRPRCIGVEFLSCGTVAECMRTFLGQIQGEAVLIQKYGNMRYFYLFESEDAKKDSLGSKKDKGPAIMPIYYNVRNCKEFHSHHYDTSGSFRLQISAWQPPQSEQKIFRDLRHSETECALAYHENIEKSCMTCLKEMGDNVAIRKMTGSTIQISMPDDFSTQRNLHHVSQIQIGIQMSLQIVLNSNSFRRKCANMSHYRQLRRIFAAIRSRFTK